MNWINTSGEYYKAITFRVKTRTNFKIGNELGRLGEDIACIYLGNKGYAILERNYRKNWGEVDIVAKKGGEIRFIEVKAVSRKIGGNVTHETSDDYRAEDNVHPAKLKRLSRTIQTYILEKGVSDKLNWHFDVYTVIIDAAARTAAVKAVRNLTLS